MTTASHPRTARHFAEGTRIVHGQHGPGVILRGCRGALYPKFDNGTTGTTSTRVRPIGA